MKKKIIVFGIVSMFLLTTLLSSIASANAEDDVILYNDDGERDETFMIYNIRDYVKKTIVIPDHVDLENAYSVKLEIIARWYLTQHNCRDFRVRLGDKDTGPSVRFDPFYCPLFDEEYVGADGYLVDITEFLKGDSNYRLKHGENTFYVRKAAITINCWEIAIDTDTNEDKSYWHDGDGENPGPEEDGELMIRLHIRYSGSRTRQCINFFSHFPILQKLLSFRQALSRVLILQ